MIGIAWFPSAHDLNVVIEVEFVRMWSYIDCIDLIFTFVIDPDVQDILGEHVALEEIFVVFL
jgi:hypothetical protein